MMKLISPRWAPAVLGLCACAATAAPPRDVLVSRELQDLYRVATGTFYLKTIGCTEQVYNERATLRLNISGKGGMLLFRTGRQCVVEKVFIEIETSKIPNKPGLF